MGLAMHAAKEKPAQGGKKSRYHPPRDVSSESFRELVECAGRGALEERQFILLSGRRDDPEVDVFYAGTLEFLKKPAVSIVGTREVTEDGRLRTRRLARELAQAGVVVVSPAPDANQPEKRKRFTLSIFDGPNGTPLDAVEASRVYRRIVSAGGRD